MAERNIDIKVRAKDETGALDRVKARLDALKSLTGNKSTLKESFELLKGAGALAGASFAANMLAEAAQGAGQLALNLTNADKSGQELTRDFAKTIPFIRQGVEIGEGIGDVVAGIGRAVGASDEFVGKWISAKSAIEEAKAALEHLGAVKDAFAPARQLEDDLTGRLFGARLKGKDEADFNLRRKEQQDAEAIKAIRDRADLDLNLKDFERKGLRDTADRLERESKRTHLAEKAELDEKYSRDVAKQDQESVHRRLDSESKFRAEDLRAHGKFLEAKLEEIEHASKEEIFEITKRAREIAEADPSRAGAAQKQALAEIEAARKLKGRRELDARNAEEPRGMRRQFEERGFRSELHLDALRTEAQLGSTAKEIELERAEIAEKFIKRREQINLKLAEDKELTAAQRKELRGILAGLDDQEEREKRIAALKRVNLGLAETQSGGGITGVASRFRTSIVELKGSILAPGGSAASQLTSAARGVNSNTAGAGGAAISSRDFGDNTRSTKDNTDAIKDLAKAMKQLLANKPQFASIFGGKI
jgi:hypothetical protein